MKNTNTAKKLFLVAIVMLCCTAIAQAKTKKDKTGGKRPAFSRGDKTLGFSLGFGVDYDYYGSAVSLPVFALHYDQGIVDNVGPGTIGVGGMIGIKTAYYKYDGYKATWTNYIVGVRGTYHLTLLKDKNNKFDPYGGVMLGIRIDNYHDSYYNNGNNPYHYNSAYPVAGLFVGAKYNFSPHFGAFAEVGYDVSLLRIGICANF